MTIEHADFPRFSRELDAEWLRQRVRATTALTSTIDEEALTRALGQADPLAQTAEPGWLASVAESLRPWPARLGVAGIACALVLFGIAIGRLVPTDTARVGTAPLASVSAAPPVPRYSPEPVSRLGMSAPVKPESERRFQEAMTFYGAADFGTRALPLLRAAVSADPSNDQAQFWLGVVLLLTGKNADAVPVLEEAVRLGPGSGLYKKYLVYAYLKTGASEKALALQTELLRQP